MKGQIEVRNYYIFIVDAILLIVRTANVYNFLHGPLENQKQKWEIIANRDLIKNYC